MNNNDENDGSSASSFRDLSSADALNSALDGLGLLSTVTSSRLQYLQENLFIEGIGALTMDEPQQRHHQQQQRHHHHHQQQKHQQQQQHRRHQHHQTPIVQTTQGTPNSLTTLLTNTQASYSLSSEIQTGNGSHSSNVPHNFQIIPESVSITQGQESSYSASSSPLACSPSHSPLPIIPSQQLPGLPSSGSKLDLPDSLLNRSIARLPNFEPHGSPSNSTTFNAPFPLDGKGSTGTEKENTAFPGFDLLTMNTNFITNFSSDYRLPSHVDGSSNKFPCSSLLNYSSDNFLNKNAKRNPFRRKRVRSHPYESGYSAISTYPTLLHMYNSSSASRSMNKSGGDSTSSQYRLRTTSLSSSGVEGGRLKRRFLHRLRGNNIHNNSSNATAPVIMMRSRSMEDLSIDTSRGDGSAATALQQQHGKCEDSLIHPRTREVENVSKAIQEMCVQDTR